MELRQLAYLVAVADERSFTRAAARLHVAQPGISAQIRRLERELGETLLERTPNGVRPTEVGRAVLAHARAALDAASEARRAVAEHADLLRGRVAVGMVVACGLADLAGLLADFHRRHPAVEVSLAEGSSDRMLDALADGTLDLAVVGLAGPPPPGVETLTIVDEPLVAAVAPEDALAGRRQVALTALAERELGCMPRGTGVRAALDRACARAGVRTRVVVEATNLGLLTRLAADGLVTAIVPESVAAERAGELAAVPVARPAVRSELALAWRAAPAGPAARALIAAAREAFGDRRREAA